jgi:hypothetical protein
MEYGASGSVGSKSDEQVVIAFMHYQVRRIDEEEAAVLRKGIALKSSVKRDPRSQRRT